MLNLNTDPLDKYLQDPLTKYLGGASPRAAPLTIDDENLLKEIAGSGLSALGWIGESLDKLGGRTVRSLLDGQGVGESLAHLIPFSDTLGITDPSTVPTGRDLLEHAGILDQNTPGLDWGDVAGFGAEVALDPSTWFGNWIGKAIGTTLTPAGKIAKTIGALPAPVYEGADKILQAGKRTQLLDNTLGDVLKTPKLMDDAAKAAEVTGKSLDDLLASPLGGNFFGTSQGGLAHSIAGAFDTAGDSLSRTRLMRQLSVMFDPNVRDAIDAPQQIAMRELSQELPSVRASARDSMFDVVKTLDNAGLMNQKPAWLDDVIEGRSAIPPEFAGTPVESSIEQMKAALADQHARARAAGIDLGQGGGTFQGQPFGYRPRKMTDVEAAKQAEYAYPRDAFSKARDTWQDLPTSVVNQMSVDPLVAGSERTLKNNADATEHLLANYLDPNATVAGLKKAQKDLLALRKQLKQQPGLYDQLGPAIEAGQQRVKEIKNIRENAEAIADRLRERPADFVKNKIEIFPNHPVQDIVDRLASGEVTIAATNKIKGVLKENAVRTSAATGGPGLVPIREAMKSAKLTTPEAKSAMASLLGVDPKQLNKFSVPKNVVKEITRIIESFHTPTSMKWGENLIRKFTNLFKLGVTTWPDFQVRNLYSGQAMNWMAGYFSAKTAKNVDQLIRNPNHVFSGLAGKGFFKNAKTDAEATEMLRRAWFAEKLTTQRQGIAGDIAGTFHDEGSLLREIPGRIPAKSIFNVPGRIKEAIPRSLAEANPFNARGISNVPLTKFAPAKVGEEVGFHVESLNRGVPFVEALKKGHTPAEAKKIADALQVNYSNSTRFETQKIKQLIPFYGWIKGIVPQIFDMLTEKPGGRMAQTIRLYNDLRNEDTGFVPERVGSGVAIGLGETTPGHQSYLSQIGLPFETLNSIFKPGANTLDTAKKTGLGLLGQINPLLKGPLEMATGRQFFQDRDLADAYSPSGNRTFDQVMMNSPLSKLYSRYHTAKSVIKGERPALPALLNSTTGLRISDIDVNKERDRSALGAIKDTLLGNGGRTFQSLYVPQESLATMTPEQVKLYRLYGGIQRRAKKQADLEKKQKQLTPAQ